MNDEQIKALWLRVTGFDADGDAADIIGFAHALLADGGKGEAVYQYKSLLGWDDCTEEEYKSFTGSRKRILYTAPQAECAPREAQPVAKIDADGDFVWLVHNPKFAEGTEFYAAPTPERADAKKDELCHCGYSKETSCNIFDPTWRADAEKDAALTDEQIREIWLRETGFDEQAAPFAILEFARAILAAKEKK
jgi:hypothetical protein